jgi:hypothetical protein
LSGNVSIYQLLLMMGLALRLAIYDYKKKDLTDENKA